jgi:hypothetical protein
MPSSVSVSVNLARAAFALGLGRLLRGLVQCDRARNALGLLWLDGLKNCVDQKVGGLVNVQVVLGRGLEPAGESVLATESIHLFTILGKLIASKINLNNETA